MAPRPPDQDVRWRIERDFACNLLVEAGAGSGKTECLARRMAAGVAEGAYAVEQMAAVTFTRKAAAELRGRFQRALEDRLGSTSTPTADQRARMEYALANLERLFSGTIHSFCATLLRERPVEAGRAPDFSELDDVEDTRLRRQAWREFWNHERASGSARLAELQETGVKAEHLDGAFARMCDHADVEFPPTLTAAPDFDAAARDARQFLADMDALLGPKGIPPATTCKVQDRLVYFRRRWSSVTVSRPARMAEALETWDRADSSLKPVQKWWALGTGKQAEARALDFRDSVVRPVLARWREYVYGVAVGVLTGAREHYASQRRRLNVVNYVDLLGETARLLREHDDVRRDLQRKYRWLFVDEFQDTDPIQAEILLWLASEPDTVGRDPWSVALRPGALFIVGDPKQSIYRFRRADIEIYNRLRALFSAAPDRAAVVALTANFRSRQAVCDLVNGFTASQFPPEADAHNPRREPLCPVEPDRAPTGECAVRVLTVPRGMKSDAAARDEAERIARTITGMVASVPGRHYGDFLVLTQLRTALPVFAEVFDRYEIPVEVSGAGRFARSPDVSALALLLRALADPSDQAALVGVLRGPLFGTSDRELFAYRTAGGTFDLVAPLDEEDDASLVEVRDREFGPVRSAMRELRTLWRLARRVPVPVALDEIVDRTGWLALAGASHGGSGAGRILQAIDCARLVLARGGGLAEAADALDGEEDGGDVEAWPLEPGRSQVVRLMNLHKAKGLEAPVVFLADASRGLPDRVDVRIHREGERSHGFFAITRPGPGGHRPVTVASPRGWAQHQDAERLHRIAELKRLTYVAATRAGELLVVSRFAPGGKPEDDAWRLLVPHVSGAAELEVPEPATRPAKSAGPLDAAAQGAAATSRASASAAAVAPSWAAALVTTEVKKIAWAGAEDSTEELPGYRPSAIGLESHFAEPGRSATKPGAVTVLGTGPDAAMQAIVPDTPSHRAERNAAWGVLIHGLLEHAMRAGGRDVPAEELKRLGLWLTVDHPELRPHLDAAVSIARAVTAAGFWRDAQGAAERHVEVPFAVWLGAGELGPDGTVLERPTLLHGVIDLVHSSADGWQVRDYKTGAMPPEVMAERYGPQLEAYRKAWERVVGRQAGG